MTASTMRAYQARQAAKRKNKRAKIITDLRTGPWTEAEDAIVRRRDLYLVEKMAMLQRSETDIKNRESRIVYGIKVVCRHCKQPFMSAASYMANGELRHHQLCSKFCQHQSQKTMVPTPCGYCGEEFIPKQATRRYCSKSCGYAAYALRRGKTHCKRGHEFTLENTLTYKGGRRVCRTCQRRRQDAENERRRGGAPSEKERLADRLNRWAELGKTYEAVDVLAAESSLNRTHIKRWLRKHGEVVPGRPARSTHCKYGHELTPENTRILGSGSSRPGKRSCRACNRQAVAESRLRCLDRNGQLTKVQKDAARLNRWAELGKTYEGVTQLAAEQSIAVKVLRKWLRERGEIVPGRTDKNYCSHGHKLTPGNTITELKKGRSAASRLCRTCRARAEKRYRDNRRKQPATGDQVQRSEMAVPAC